MEPTKIARINELARKKKSVGLTQNEHEEHQALHREYLDEFRESTRAMLENVRVQNPDGTVTPLKKKPPCQ